jgi:hypothetical protein
MTDASWKRFWGSRDLIVAQVDDRPQWQSWFFTICISRDQAAWLHCPGYGEAVTAHMLTLETTGLRRAIKGERVWGTRQFNIVVALRVDPREQTMIPCENLNCGQCCSAFGNQQRIDISVRK